ncbi:reverse transcriptase [Lithospermum erythrorhizon]|uniref:Reverse transcriptase n=1 Tax=Lithospermum erythrorhizon TaxID=34254 RepID=A0AAV3NZL6_LITER
MVEQADEEVQQCEAAYEGSLDTALREALHQAKAKYLRSLAIQEDFLSQQSGINWIQEGDKNTGFYHNYIRKKRKKSAILGILDDGEWIVQSEDIEESGVKYFRSLFSGDSASNDEEMIDCIPLLVSNEDNVHIMLEPTMEELRQIVFSLNKDSVGGPDGFNGHFFHNFWPLIAEDLLAAVKQFLDGSSLHQSFTSTTIALIPKMDNPKSWKDYRPISLCSFVNKVISKLLSTRIANILPNLISENQAGFVRGRLIQDNILLAQEMMHNIDKGNKYGNVILNLDMEKAFDRLSWDFLCKILAKFGFSTMVIERIRACLDNNWFSVLINGKSSGFFKSEKGVRQGDPLSPALFILAEEYLLRGLNQLYARWPNTAYNCGYGVRVSSLAFADDVLVFANGSKMALSKVMDFLQHYQRISGQLVNMEKSTYILPNKASTSRSSIVQRATGFRRGEAPFNYLGIPIYKGKKQCFLFEDLLEKLRGKVESWSSNFLSFGGKITLLQSVLNTIPIYYLQVMQMPAEVYGKIERLFNKFLWDGIPWCKWSQVCAPYEEGGLNIRSLEDIRNTFLHKMWVRLREGTSLWSKFMMSKYCRKYHPKMAPVHPSHSRVWKNLHKVREEAEEHIHWQVGDGSCDFWLDSWSELGSLIQFYPEQRGGLLVKELWTDGQWDLEKLSALLRPEHVEKVSEVFIHKGYPDRLIWKSSQNGEFSFKEAFEEGRHQRPCSVISYALWHNNIPKKMSFVAWRLWKGWLPVDDTLGKRGIHLASKCQCCEQVETLEHVFFSNQIADRVWAHYANLVGMRHVQHTSVQQVIAAWSLSVSTKGHIKQVLPIVILWALWEARNKAKHKAAKYSFQQICHRVHTLLLLISKANMTQRKFWSGDSYLGASLGVTVEVKQQQAPRLLSWDRPEKNSFKLNIDAAFKENRAGYGGIIRDEQGGLVYAVGFQGLCSSSIQAEVDALLLCLRSSVQKGYSRLQIEVDSMLLVNMVTTQKAHWQLIHKVLQIAELLSSSGSSLVHIFREKNLAADWIAKKAWKNQANYIWEANTTDKGMQGLIRLEQSGLPQLRTKH